MGGRGSSGGNNPGGSKATAKPYHVSHTDSAGGEFIDSGTISGKTIGNKTSLEYGGENRTGTIVGAHKYPNGKVDFTVRMDETKFSKAVTKTVSENRLKTTPANKSNAATNTVLYQGKNIKKMSISQLTKALDRTSANGDMKMYNALDKEAQRRGTSGYKLLTKPVKYTERRR